MVTQTMENLNPDPTFLCVRSAGQLFLIPTEALIRISDARKRFPEPAENQPSEALDPAVYSLRALLGYPQGEERYALEMKTAEECWILLADAVENSVTLKPQQILEAPIRVIHQDNSFLCGLTTGVLAGSLVWLLDPELLKAGSGK